MVQHPTPRNPETQYEFNMTHPEYDDFSKTYQDWAVAASPYTIIETYRFFQTLGPLDGLNILDLATGEGRTARMLIDRGANSVLGGDVSPQMIQLAQTHDQHPAGSNLHFQVIDARDDTFTLDQPVDVVTAMYLFHYAQSQAELARMANLIARNLKPGGRLVTYTVNPEYDFKNPQPQLMDQFGFDYSHVNGPEYRLKIGGGEVSFWQWSRQAHETALTQAGLTNIQWHPVDVPPQEAALRQSVDWFLTNPSCIVLSATKPG